MTAAYAGFLLAIATRTLVILLVVAFGVRLFGKRQAGQMNIYDLALITAMANAVQNAMTAGKGDLSVGMVSAAALLLAGRGLTWLFLRHPALERRIVGTPTLLVSDGRLIERNVRREAVGVDELQGAIRAHGLAGIQDVKLAILEVDGSISVVPKEGRQADGGGDRK